MVLAFVAGKLATLLVTYGAAGGYRPGRADAGTSLGPSALAIDPR
jgi:hypothetical protein